MQNEHYQRFVSTKDIIIKSSMKTYHWYNKNKLLNTYKYCTRGKTGFTKKARRTLVTTASKNNMNLIVVTFNDGNDFNDHKSLYEKYFNNYEVIKVIDKEDDYGKNIKLKDDYYLIKDKKEKVETNIVIEEESPSEQGSIVGKVEVILNGEVLGYRNLYYEKPSVTENKSFLSKLLDFLKFW